ncbi:WD40 repeat-containing protein (plasmid) [Mesorhizobium loti]|nr:WD40 repeat-containing protein [Mesorhizobium loti]
MVGDADPPIPLGPYSIARFSDAKRIGSGAGNGGIRMMTPTDEAVKGRKI